MNPEIHTANFLKDPSLTSILEQLHSYLKQSYQNNLHSVILFGSQARGDAAPDSDIDILVLLKKPFDSHQENKKNSQFIADLCLQYDTVISCFLMNCDTWQNTNNAFTRNVRQEGITL